MSPELRDKRSLILRVGRSSTLRTKGFPPNSTSFVLCPRNSHRSGLGGCEVHTCCAGLHSPAGRARALQPRVELQRILGNPAPARLDSGVSEMPNRRVGFVPRVSELRLIFRSCPKRSGHRGEAPSQGCDRQTGVGAPECDCGSPDPSESGSVDGDMSPHLGCRGTAWVRVPLNSRVWAVDSGDTILNRPQRIVS